MIFLEHPQHGTHIAYSDIEVAACEKNGWKRREILTARKPAPAEAVEIAAPDGREVLVEAYRQKFGKKPHHKLSVESLKAALA